MKRQWALENDEDGLAGEPCDQWIVRDVLTDNRDVIAIIPKTGDEEYDDEVVFQIARVITSAPQMLSLIQRMVDADKYDVLSLHGLYSEEMIVEEMSTLLEGLSENAQ